MIRCAGSGSITTPSGMTLAFHTRTQDENELPHATKKTMTDHLRKYESLFTLTPQRMRMIVDSFDETFEKGLAEPEQVVVRTLPACWEPRSDFSMNDVAYDSHICVRLADW